MQYQEEIRLKIESCPDCWFRNISPNSFNRQSYLTSLLQRLARYLGIENWEDLVFITNASHGVNAVLRSIGEEIYDQQCGGAACKLLYLSTAYPMVKNTMAFLVSTFSNEQLVEVNVTTPMLSNNTLLLQAIEQAIQMEINNNNGKNPIYLASFSHITSTPAVILPVAQIIALCKKYGILTLIDGVNVSTLDPDFYLSNGHKWLYSSRGSAILYVKKDYQNLIFPVCISNLGEGDTPFQKQFLYQGTNDDSGWLSMDGALNFREQWGDTAIMQYMHNLAVDGGYTLANMWDTNVMTTNNDTIGALVNVQLPTQNSTEVTMLQTTLFDNYFTYMVVFQFQNVWYTRLSAQIFLELSDFVWLGQTCLNILQKMRQPK
ncbi:hypothetical protein RFI_01646 [Reticulomyxa filosa]|uniref:Aminotransferase class V domain-containing protein n=1 Tax=Reticulomyxa filosa TaxID=46433 RepID=X6PCP2_RETFI|nr:hypothetical protein RFI_01646 [Reticulomyxa filosa]|eukprot:ETO35417.1 hypothetical protein RFI_01646 [Reticulomyxa filosa]